MYADDNLSKFQWIFAKLGMCIDIVEILFGITNGQFHQFLKSYLPETCPCFRFQAKTSICQWIFANFGMCIDILEI